jgi:DnaJ-domain-containing protein 1
MQELVEGMPEPGVIATLWAEGQDGGGVDLGGDAGAGDVDLGDGEGAEGAEAGGEGDEGAGQGEQQEEQIDGRKGSKEYREALKAWKATPEGAKFAETARADHFRVNELAAIEPGGVAAIRDKYALLESVGGAEGVTQLQERVAEVDATDQALASGDPKALEALGPDFDPGLAKLTPAILERVMRADPQAYAAAILPHLMSGLAGSPLVGDLNRMIDVLQAPHLDEKGKVGAIAKLLGQIGQWFEANERKAGELKAAPENKERGDLDQRRSEVEKLEQKSHWDNRIAPAVVSHEKTKLEELFKPFDSKLKLDPAAKADLFETFKQKMKAAGLADAAYMKQMAIYRKQKNPDPAVVANFVKSAINRHAKAVVESAVRARYGRFLGAAKKPGTTTAVPGARAATGKPGAGVIIVSAKPAPETIDYRRTSEADQWKGLYTLKNGKKVKWVKQA